MILITLDGLQDLDRTSNARLLANTGTMITTHSDCVELLEILMVHLFTCCRNLQVYRMSDTSTRKRLQVEYHDDVDVGHDKIDAKFTPARCQERYGTQTTLSL